MSEKQVSENGPEQVEENCGGNKARATERVLTQQPCRSGVMFKRYLPPAHADSSPADFSVLKMEAIRSSETSVHTRSTRRNTPEEGILLGSHLIQCLPTKITHVVVKPFNSIRKDEPASNFGGTPTITTEVFRGCPQSLQAGSEAVC
jgi:hypothetical protein